MISKIQKDFLLLFQCIIDFGAEVLRDFTEEKIKIKYKTENFSIFLENTRHCLYHQWEKTKVPCCQCPVHGFNIPKTGRMDKTIYDKLYSFNSSKKCPKGHFIKNDTIIVQTCICRFTAENITINELDLSDLNAILVGLRSINTPMICKSEEVLINEIMIVRGKVCHAVTTTKFSEPELTGLWAKFTNALYSLCPGDKKNVKWLKKTIETTKKTILSEEEVQELMSKVDIQERDIQDISEDVKKIMIDKTAELKNCVINESAGINAHLDSTLQSFNDTQEKHFELLLDIKDQLKVLIERSPCPSFYLQTHPSDIRTQSPSDSVLGKRDIQMTCTIGQPSLTEEMEQKIVDSIPDEINVTHDEEKQTLKIKSKKVNSIVLEIDATCEIFQSPSKLLSAICDLVDMVLDKGEVDKNAEDPILVTLSFESTLTEDEKATVINLLTTKYELINEGLNVRPKKRKVEETIEENDMATHLSEKRLACCQEDEYITQRRTQDWLTEVQTNASSDSAIGKSITSGFSEDLIPISDIFYLGDSLYGLFEDLDIDKRIWLAVGISLHAIIASELRICAEIFFSKLYDSMMISDRIEQQTYPNYLKFYSKSKSCLNYEAINNNKKDHGNAIHKFDYRVKNATDASKLFLPIAMTQYKDLHTCSLSSLIEIIRYNEDIIPKDAKDILREVSSNIKDIWTRCDFTQWDEARFSFSFNLMEEFVKKLQLTNDVESTVLETLNKWINIVHIPHTLTAQPSETPHVVGSEINNKQPSTSYSGPNDLQVSTYCIRCRKKTTTVNTSVRSIRSRPMSMTRVFEGTCTVCGGRKASFC